MPLDRDAVRRVIDLLAQSSVGEIEIEDGDVSVRAQRRPITTASVPVAAEPVLEEGATAPTETVVERSAAAEGPVEYVTAGLVGLFHHGRAPDSAPLVSVGDQVTRGQVIGTIEALRKLTDVVATCTGVIVEVLVDDGEPVQYGDRLFAIRGERM
jgi:biotin carboxyl carrier protein